MLAGFIALRCAGQRQPGGPKADGGGLGEAAVAIGETERLFKLILKLRSVCLCRGNDVLELSPGPR